MAAMVESLTAPGAEGELQPPPHTLMVPMMRHQRLALAWMATREEAALGRGGILADDQVRIIIYLTCCVLA